MHRTIAALLCAQTYAIRIGSSDGWNIKVKATISVDRNEDEPSEVSWDKPQLSGGQKFC